MAEVAVEFGVERFVLISTDKAAKPKNLLGQSKAVCEWIVESFAARDDVDTKLRRGALRQRARLVGLGDPDLPPADRARRPGHRHRTPSMTRFFMTIPEASSLVVQAGSMGGKGQIYVLDMGTPVKIVDLARQMIELSGRTEEQIPISFVGARAGEKLHEELWNEGEDVGPTKHPKIMRARRVPIDRAWLEDELAGLERLVGEGDTLNVVTKLGTMMREQQRTGAAHARGHAPLAAAWFRAGCRARSRFSATRANGARDRGWRRVWRGLWRRPLEGVMRRLPRSVDHSGMKRTLLLVPALVAALVLGGLRLRAAERPVRRAAGAEAVAPNLGAALDSRLAQIALSVQTGGRALRSRRHAAGSPRHAGQGARRRLRARRSSRSPRERRPARARQRRGDEREADRGARAADGAPAARGEQVRRRVRPVVSASTGGLDDDGAADGRTPRAGELLRDDGLRVGRRSPSIRRCPDPPTDAFADGR